MRQPNGTTLLDFTLGNGTVVGDQVNPCPTPTRACFQDGLYSVIVEDFDSLQLFNAINVSYGSSALFILGALSLEVHIEERAGGGYEISAHGEGGVELHVTLPDGSMRSFFIPEGDTFLSPTPL